MGATRSPVNYIFIQTELRTPHAEFHGSNTENLTDSVFSRWYEGLVGEKVVSVTARSRSDYLAGRQVVDDLGLTEKVKESLHYSTIEGV